MYYGQQQFASRKMTAVTELLIFNNKENFLKCRKKTLRDCAKKVVSALTVVLVVAVV